MVEDAAVVIAITQAIKHLLGDKVSGWVTIVIAGIVGGILAYLRSIGIVIPAGVYAGLVAAGGITAAKTISSQPSK